MVRVAEGEPEADRDRALAVRHELAGGVVDGGDVVRVEGVPHTEGVRGQPQPDAEQLRRRHVVVVRDDQGEQHAPAEHGEEQDGQGHPDDRDPLGPGQARGRTPAQRRGRGPPGCHDRDANAPELLLQLRGNKAVSGLAGTSPRAALESWAMELTDFEALSFDCYGTLIDWEAGIGAVLAPWAHENGLDLDREALLAAYAGHEAATESAQPGALYPHVLASSFCALGAQLGVPVTNEWAAALGNSVPDWPAFPDSHEALAALATRYKLIIVSNVHRAGFAASNERLGVPFDRDRHRAGRRLVQAGTRTLRRAGRGARRPRRRAGTAAARRAEPLPRPRAGEAARAAHGVDRPAARPARLGRHPAATCRRHAGLDVPVHEGVRRCRDRFRLTAPRQPGCGAATAAACPARAPADRGS